MTGPFNPPPPPPFDQATSASEAPTLIAQGAEGILYRSHHLTTSRPCAIKYRPPKTWRHPTLDARLTRHRILAEARILVKCRREGISVPGVLALDWEGSLRRQPEGPGGAAEARAEQRSQRYGGWMMTEWIEGMTVRRALNAWLPRHVAVQKEPTAEEREMARTSGGESARPEQVKSLMRRIGAEVGRLHQAGVIHGDLTTSNLMIRVKGPGGSEGVNGDRKEVEGSEQEPRPPLDGQVVIIDFGLATQSSQDEDRAVDLYVLERAYGSTHPDTEDLFDMLLDAYRVSFKTAHIALKRLDEVRLRGRKKSMLG